MIDSLIFKILLSPFKKWIISKKYSDRAKACLTITSTRTNSYTTNQRTSQTRWGHACSRCPVLSIAVQKHRCSFFLSTLHVKTPIIFSSIPKIPNTVKFPKSIYNQSLEDSNSRTMQVCFVKKRNLNRKTCLLRNRNSGTLSLTHHLQRVKK